MIFHQISQRGWVLLGSIMFFSTFIFFGNGLQAQDFYGEWQQRLFAMDPVFIQDFENYQQDWENAKNTQTRWLPQISLTPSYSLSKDSPGPEPVYNQSGAVSLNVSQKMPWGGTLTGGLSQTMTNVVGGAENWGYSGSGSLGLTAPVALWEQGFGFFPFYTWLEGFNAQKASVLNSWESVRLRRIAGTLKVFISGLIDREAQKNQSRLLDWYRVNDETDQALWQAGQLSSLERTDRTQKWYTARQQYRQAEKSLLDTFSQIKNWGLDPETENPELWLDRWEKASPPESPAKEKDLLSQQDVLLQSRGSQWQEELSSLPQLSLSYSITPGVSVSGKSYPGEALSSYWEGPLPWNWTLNVQVTWPLVPWDPVYHVNEKARAQRRILDAKEQDLIASRNRWEDSRDRTLKILTNDVQQAQETFALEKDRAELYALKVKTGQMSSQELDYQFVQTENARLTWLRARLELLVYEVTGD